MRLTVLDGRPSNTVTCRGLGGTGCAAAGNAPHRRTSSSIAARRYTTDCLLTLVLMIPALRASAW
jgi:hypothetical protein